MHIGSLVKLSETARLSLGIDNNSYNTFGIIVDTIDLTPMFDVMEGNVIGYRVFVPGGNIEIVYEEDILEFEDE